MTKALVIAETESGARELCAGARTMADEIVLVRVGAPAITGAADKCVHVDVPEGAVADDGYLTLNGIFDAEGAQVVLGEPTERTLSLIGRLAAHAHTAAITDAMSIEDGCARSMYFGGAGVRSAKSAGDVAIFTVGAGVYDGAAATGTDVVEEAAFQAPSTPIVKTATEALPKSDVNLAAADAIAAAGRGFADEADLALLRDVAAKIGAEVGCSRPLTEAVDWFPREAYVGVSGQMVAPKVYLAAGISGQMQHMVGCNRAGTVFAINKDKNAPIFKQCDFGLVGDLKTVLPALAAAL